MNKLIKEAQTFMPEAANTPTAAYKQDVKRISDSMKDMAKMWKKIQANYEQYLKNNPTGWKGVGRGSELSALAADMEDVTAHMELMLD
jgi:hypothetical protein